VEKVISRVEKTQLGPYKA